MKYNRRSIFFGLPALIMMPHASFSLTENGAEKIVLDMIASVQTIINSRISNQEKIKRFEAIFIEFGDLPRIAGYSLGVDGRRASPEQKKRFTAAFANYLAVKYGRRFEEFAGGEVSITRVAKIKHGFEISTKTKIRGSSAFVVSYKLFNDQDGNFRFFDMAIEGVSLLMAERNEIGSMLDRNGGDLEILIRELESF